MKQVTVATLTITRPNKFTKSGAKDVAKWLRHQADMLEKSHVDYDDEYKAKYAFLKSEIKKGKK